MASFDTLLKLEEEFDEEIEGVENYQAEAMKNQAQPQTYKLYSEMAKQELQQAIAAEGQATRNMIQQDKMEAMRDRIQNLELQNAMQGVVRYPNGFVYNAGANPFCGCGCGNGFGNI